MADHDELITRFCELTSASADEATEYLIETSWDLDQAVSTYFTVAEEQGNSPMAGAAPAEPEYTGPRTLDGRPAPEYAGASSSAAKKPQKRTGLATLSSIGGGNHDDDDDDEDDDDEDERGPRDLFAGGEKSGLAVQDPAQRSSDPNKLVNDLLAKAKADARKNQSESSSSGPSRYFRGGGQTLGGDGVESRRVGETQPIQAVPETPAEERTLHLWTDGFSVDDGPLHRFDDPQNRSDLAMIREGRAPLHLMNVRYDQRVDVKLVQHAEQYRQLPRVYRPFSGEGRRLGSPVPGVEGLAGTPSAPAPAAAAAPQTQTTGVNESQPTTMLRIQLPDGTRLPARFNLTQTIGDVYEFIGRSSSSLSARPWVLSTTFPNKDHTEKGLVLGDLAEFKRGGAAVVKWL